MTQPNPYAGIGLTYPRRSKLFPDPSRPHFEREKPGPGPELNLRNLLRFSPITTVLAQIDDRTMSLLGRVSCTLKLSFGSLVIHTTQSMLPYQFANESWVRATVLLARGDKSYHRLLEAVPVHPEEGDPTTSWLPLAPCARSDHLRRLQSLLSELDPGLQAIFAGAVSDAAVHRNFLTCVSASDHHVYPGGLLDHAVEAAEAVWTQSHLTERERAVGALVCLIFDLGKTRNTCLRPDRERLVGVLKPHPMTMTQLQHTLQVVKSVDAALVADVCSLLDGFRLGEVAVEEGVALTLAQCVCKSIIQSWRLGLTGVGDVLYGQD